MIAASLEWFLLITAFDYNLLKAYKKAEDSSTRLLALVMIVLYTALRYGSRIWIS